jgi:hypothetical protein
MFAILFPEKRADAAMAEVKRMANDPIPVAQRPARSAALQREIDELSHVEEALVEAAIACGFHWSPSALPQAVLGVRIAERASRAPDAKPPGERTPGRSHSAGGPRSTAESPRIGLLPVAASHPATWLGAGKCPLSPTPEMQSHGAEAAMCKSRTLPRRYSITSLARNTINGGTVGAWRFGVLAFSAVTVSIGRFPSPDSEPKRVFTSSQPAIADEILGIERRCFTPSSLGGRIRSGGEGRAQAGIDVVIAEGLL